MEQLVEIIVLILLSSVKFALAVSYLLFNKGFSYWQTVIILLTGGSLGILVFYYFGNYIMHKWFAFRKKPQRRFTKTNRYIVKVRKKYGLIGLSLLTPILFSIPLGCIVAARYYSYSPKVIISLLLGVVWWSFVLPLLTIYFK